QSLQKTRVDQPPNMVQHRRRVTSQPLRDLLVGQRLPQAKPQDPEPQRRPERARLGLGRSPPRRPDSVRRAGSRLRLGHAISVAATVIDISQSLVQADSVNRESLLFHRDFRLLWTGNAISQVGTMITVIAMPLLAVRTL